MISIAIATNRGAAVGAGEIFDGTNKGHVVPGAGVEPATYRSSGERSAN